MMAGSSRNDFQVLVTAEEAWPAFERAVLGAQRQITAGFRIFDMSTRLRSPEARAIGESWFDLLAHVLCRGVRVELTVSDFDPVMATDLHEMAWKTVRQGAALGEIACVSKDLLRVRAHRHPVVAGAVPWVSFLPAVLKKRRQTLARIRPERLARQAIGLHRQALPRLSPVTHHHKVAVIDDDLLYIGGLDLNRRRYDTANHDRPARQTWSDVQLLLRGPEAAAARTHLETLGDVTAGRQRPPDANPGLRRTLSAPRRMQMPYLSPRTLLNEIEIAHLDAFRTARHLIHIETQFLRSSRIAKALARAALKNPTLTALIILPGLPEDVAFEASDSLDARYGIALKRRAFARLRAAFGHRLTVATPVRPVMAAVETPQTLAGSPLIHVHNKVLVKDDDFAMIGSANLNGRSMRWDTELAFQTSDTYRVAKIRDKLIAHWWQTPPPVEARRPEALQPWWDREIRRNALRRAENRTGFLVPHDTDAGRDIERPLPGVTEDIV